MISTIDYEKSLHKHTSFGETSRQMQSHVHEGESDSAAHRANVWTVYRKEVKNVLLIYLSVQKKTR